jgi:antitoxin (DNA-binding transcriptional repressor) of toxin-antitoxin stability system
VQRINVTEAERNFADLVNQVYTEGISIELVRGDKVVARLSAAAPHSSLKIRDLNTFLQNLPKLGDDAEVFSQDIGAISRIFPAESNSWD